MLLNAITVETKPTPKQEEEAEAAGTQVTHKKKTILSRSENIRIVINPVVIIMNHDEFPMHSS